MYIYIIFIDINIIKLIKKKKKVIRKKKNYKYIIEIKSI